MIEFPENVLEMINARLGGFNLAMGMRFTHARPDEFRAELTVEPHHLQPYGLVHGGVYCGMIEAVCSTAAALNVFAEGKSAVGLENSTSFLRAVRGGTLRCCARPLSRGRRSQVWQAEVHDDEYRLVATGRVRLMVLERGARAGGETVALKTEA